MSADSAGKHARTHVLSDSVMENPELHPEALEAEVPPPAVRKAPPDGHSKRRTGAQLLAWDGIEPWVIAWFGRWGSRAMLAYLDDSKVLQQIG